ncbi:TetR/AcrR family transcriptional regulator C-terminal domain-containing protein [Streptomyces antimicrobicus]|uniref:TetR/AcrR family transcriptional regulator C-terminal domain-containing protein n=1 Tax=Streptomyces antimicrobicus TaxID=2883108 RepID=A0ABS8BAS2_9ACTN|nr:TetR/AcrR family transcriptional regulator C-terminal domain-containing protein [Streptomyces antimicrobicus]MCB5181727.1 TetR/AcrR family transcriptional regulator C-terminal domain-containing protein [Streptomyces antimicrobicus]
MTPASDRTPPRVPPLSRETVAEAALRLLNETGLDKLTLRAIATELNVKAPALYWHFRNKQELIDEMATEMYRRMTAAPQPLTDGASPPTWRDRVMAACVGLRRALLAYRDGARVFSGSRFTGTEHAEHTEVHLRALLDAGFDLPQAVRTFSTAFAYTLGFVSEEQGVQPMPGERREGYDVTERGERLAAYPVAAAAGPHIFEDYDAHFEEGLHLILDGVSARYGIR